VPHMESEDNFKLYDPEITLQGARKEFKQVIIPMSDAVKRIPRVTFSYFDVEEGRYKTIRKGPLSITVDKLSASQQTKIVSAAADSMVQEFVPEKLGRDIAYIKDSLGTVRRKGQYFHRSLGFTMAFLFPLMVFIAAFAWGKHQERLSSDVRYARRLRAPKKAHSGLEKAKVLLQQNNTAQFYAILFKTMQEYLGDRFHVASGGITGEIVDTVLKQRGVEQALLEKIGMLFQMCDQARYASATINKEHMEHVYHMTEEIIDYLERHKV